VSGKQNIVVLMGLAAAVAVALFALLFRKSSPQNVALTGREQAMELLGARITELRPKCSVLVLANPLTKNSGKFDRAGLHGLRLGLGSHSSLSVAFPEIKPEYAASPQSVPVPQDSRTPLSFLIEPASVDELAEAHPHCRVIVSLIGLPVGADKLKVWGEKDPRSFALLYPDLRLLGPPAEAVAAFQRGKLLAAVVDDPTSGKPLIVTKDNIVEVLEQKQKALGY
jgi:hypothetical protein